MKPSQFGIIVRRWLAALCAIVLVSCGGGGGDSGASSDSLTPAATQAAVQELAHTFAATLTGAQAVPQRSSGATGSGTVVIDPVTGVMTATLTTTGIVGTAAHISQAPPSVNGPIIFPLTETFPGSGVWVTRAIVSAAQYNAFRAGDFYFNVPSINFAGGEIRGQITPQQPGVAAGTSSGNVSGIGTTTTRTGINPFVTSNAIFLAALRGSQEVPPNDSTALGSGTALVNQANRLLITAVTTTGIAGDAAHIHEAPPGVNGPIIIPLTESPPGSGIWTANATLTEAQYASMQAGNMYFNVHSAAFPAGEIRGQILPQLVSREIVTGGAAGAIGATGLGTPPIGMSGIPISGIGTTGIGTTGTGLIGTGTTGIGTSITGTPGTGTMAGTDTAGLAF